MDTIGMDSYPFIAAAAAVIVVPEQDRVLLVGRRKGNPFPERFFRPARGGKTGPDRSLAHVRSLRDKWSYRASLTRRNPPSLAPLENLS